VSYANTREFLAQNRQKNKNIQPGPEKQHSYLKKSVIWNCGNCGNVSTWKHIHLSLSGIVFFIPTLNEYQRDLCEGLK